jgi:hypothetical protein
MYTSIFLFVNRTTQNIKSELNNKCHPGYTVILSLIHLENNHFAETLYKRKRDRMQKREEMSHLRKMPVDQSAPERALRNITYEKE